MRGPVSLGSPIAVGFAPAAASSGAAGAWLRVARAVPGVRETALVATCHRAEIYLVADDPAAALAGLALLGEARWTLPHPAAARHLLRVACGLDSPILGDGQVLGQVRRAYLAARHAGTTGPILNRLFETALRAGKRTRHVTALGRGAVTTGSAAAGLAERLAAGIAGRHLLVIGAGETAALAARHLASRHPAAIVIANRSAEPAAALARAIGGASIGLDALLPALAAADIVVSATSRPGVVVSAGLLAAAMASRQARQLTAIDLAAPADIEAACAAIPGVVLGDLAAVEREADTDRASRAAAIPAVEAIVEDHLSRFDAWRAGAHAADVIRSVRTHVTQARERAMARAAGGPGDRAALDRRTRRVMNRVLHRTVTRLKSLPGTPEGEARLSDWRHRLGAAS